MSTVQAHASCSTSYRAGQSQSEAHAIPTLRTRGRHFIDEHGRVAILHGCSVSGLNKLPTQPNGATHLPEGFFDHEHVSFVGRPFPLHEAHDHFARLKQWGLTFIRLVIPWESMEHEGPGIYDEEYIDFLVKLISMMPKYGIKCYIDAHQDVWSRHTGGSGAPHWTLEVAGLDIRNLKATGAAHAHQLHLEPDDPPPKVWPSGYCKLAAATCATLFWAGETFAPKCTISTARHKQKLKESSAKGELVSVQEFLQQSMISAFGHLADKVADLEAVMGFEVINEPHRGYIELHSPYSWDFKTDLAIGHFPTPVQSWALGAGHSVLVHHYGPSFPVTDRTHTVLFRPPKGRTAWLDGQCIWQRHGVWAWDPNKGELGEPVCLRTEYFTKHPVTGKPVEWYKEFYWPFCQRFADRITRSRASLNTFVGTIPNEFCPPWPEDLRPKGLVFAPHWYDLQSLFSKSLGHMSANVQGLARGMFILKALYFGRTGLKNNYATQIGNIINAGLRSLGEVPIVVGETGVPMDMNDKTAFKTGDFGWQERQMDAICSALERSMVSFNLWNYNPLNEDEWGDSWNSENFSWFSTSAITKEALDAAATEEERLNVGGRILDAVQRPYAAKIAGIPIETTYDFQSLTYELRYCNPAGKADQAATDEILAAHYSKPPLCGTIRARETEVFLPRRLYAQLHAQGKMHVQLRDGSWHYNPEKQTLYVLHENESPGFEHRVEVWVEGRGTMSKQQVKYILAFALAFWALARQYRHHNPL